MLFRDRYDAGRELGAVLADAGIGADPIVLGLPRGGVPVAYEVARALGAPLDVFLVRKLGLPGHPELAMGAIASGGVRVLNEDLVRGLGIGEDIVDEVASLERAELRRRERLYRGDRPPQEVLGRTAVLVDDGLATGASMRAAAAALRDLGPARIVIAVPVAPASTCEELADEVDDVVCVAMPPRFQAVGQYYADFSQTSDEEVGDLLARAARERLVA